MRDQYQNKKEFNPTARGEMEWSGFRKRDHPLDRVVLVDELMNAVQGKITNVSSRERTRRKKSARRVCALPSRARRGDASRLSTYLPV